jgi:hypothetical protein
LAKQLREVSKRIAHTFWKKWLRYQRVISLEAQVGITSQRNTWTNTKSRIYRRWDQVPRRSKHPLLIGRTHSYFHFKRKKNISQISVKIRETEPAVKISVSNQVNGRNPQSKSVSRSTKWNNPQNSKYQACTDTLKHHGWGLVPRRVSIPCWSITPAVSQVPWSWMRSYPLSKSVCQVRSNYWYEKCQTTYGSMKGFDYELDHCNRHRTWKMLTSNETVEIPATSTCLSVVYFDWKADCM